MKERTSYSARWCAWQSLQRWEAGGVFAETLVAKAAMENRLSSADRSMLQAIVFGTLRHLGWLRHVCSSLRKGQLEASVKWLVLVGLCQIFVLRLPDHAAVSETVTLAPNRVRGLVNAMLRNAIRNREALEQERETLPLSLRYSTPNWLVKRWIREFGEEETVAMLDWNTQTPVVYARVNTLCPPEPMPESLQPLPGIPGWYRVMGGLPMAELREGRVYVADPATRHCIRLLNPQPGERILDACAAPGGKSAAIIAATGGQVSLLATDMEEHRLEPLRENLQRAGGEDVTVASHDWSTAPLPEWCGVFDGVLLDVPCSNSGVLQRRVDVRWRLCAEEITRLAALQGEILEQGAKALRPGGRLVYSTCSIDREEDHAVVEQFLVRHPEFVLEDEVLILPHREQTDGAYAALLRLRSL